MGVAVVENIPFSANTLDTAVIGTRGVQPVPIFAAFIAHIAIGNDGSAVGKVSGPGKRLWHSKAHGP